MFFFTYLRRELRRRMRQAVVIAAGLALGIALVITVTALSSGVRSAQGKGARGAVRGGYGHHRHHADPARVGLGRL